MINDSAQSKDPQRRGKRPPKNQGVEGEPSMFPGSENAASDFDSACEFCGYDLRGQPDGAACPECGRSSAQRSASNPDRSERQAADLLSKERRESGSTYRSGQSIYDEPDIFPGRPAAVIDRDWSCSTCGYNLRGRRAGEPCPECGQTERYHPPPTDAESYGTWLLRRVACTPPAVCWLVAATAALIGGLFGILGALIETPGSAMPFAGQLILLVVFGPTVEEVMKLGAASLIVETRPYYFQDRRQLWLAALGSAFTFAAVENLMYLKVYIANPSTSIVLWRWTACVALHMTCTGVAASGLERVRRRVYDERRAPQLSEALPMLATAIAIHGAYNATILGIESAGWLSW